MRAVLYTLKDAKRRTDGNIAMYRVQLFFRHNAPYPVLKDK